MKMLTIWSIVGLLCMCSSIYSAEKRVTVSHLSKLAKEVGNPHYQPLSHGTLVTVDTLPGTNKNPYIVLEDYGGDKIEHTVVVGKVWSRLCCLPLSYDAQVFSYYNDGEKQETNGQPTAGLLKTNDPREKTWRSTKHGLMMQPLAGIVAFWLGQQIFGR